MQTDPIGYEDQMNLYAYVGNDPMNHTDPLGLNNCEVVPGGTKDCIGNDDAKPDSEEENKKKEVIDEIVVKGKRTKGGNPNLYRAVRMILPNNNGHLAKRPVLPQRPSG